MYTKPEMKSVTACNDICTLSVSDTAEQSKGWGNLDFGGKKNSPLADLANDISAKI